MHIARPIRRTRTKNGGTAKLLSTRGPRICPFLPKMIRDDPVNNMVMYANGNVAHIILFSLQECNGGRN